MNMLSLIIQSNPSQFDIQSIKNKMVQLKKMTLPLYLNHSNHLFYRYNVLYGSKSSNLIRTYSPKLRPRSASVQSFMKIISTQINHEVLNVSEISQLFDAKCKDLNVKAKQELELRFKEFVTSRCVNGIIDLSECNIGKNSISIIGNIILRYDNISRIILQHNQIGDQGLELLIPIISQSNSIIYLNLASNDIGIRGGSMLLKMLIDNNSIISLNLSSLEGINRNRLTAEGIKPIEDLLKRNKFLEILKLSGNSIKNEGLRHLLSGLDGNYSLKELDISNNDIDEKGIELISSMLTSSQLLNLHLGGNPIHNEGLALLSKCLMSDGLRLVNSINVSDCKITMEGFKQFFLKLCSNITLNYIIFNKNYLSSKGFIDLEIPFSTMNIKFLGLSGCSIGKTAYEIAELLKSNSSIKAIDLSNNQMGDKGFAEFVTLPIKNYSLDYIDFSKNLLSDESGKGFFSKMEHNHIIKHLHFYDNQFQAITANIIYHALRNNKTIVTLNISRNQIQMKMMKDISGLVYRNKVLLKQKYLPSIKLAIKSLAFNEKDFEVLKDKIEHQKWEQENLKEKIIEDIEKFKQMKQDEAEKSEAFIAKGDELKREVKAFDQQLKSLLIQKEEELSVYHETTQRLVTESNEINETISSMGKEHRQYEIERELIISDLKTEMIKVECNVKNSNEKLQLMKLSVKMIQDELKEKTLTLDRLNNPISSPVINKEDDTLAKRAKLISKKNSRIMIKSKSYKDKDNNTNNNHKEKEKEKEKGKDQIEDFTPKEENENKNTKSSKAIIEKEKDKSTKRPKAKSLLRKSISSIKQKKPK